MGLTFALLRAYLHFSPDTDLNIGHYNIHHATDGSNASYLLPVSFWGGVVVIGLALAYTATLMFFGKLADRKPS
jgi:hypothetical protein